MRRRRAASHLGAAAAVLALLLSASGEALADPTAPHRSVSALPSSNGFAAIAFDVASSRVNQFLEHPYRFPSVGVETRDFAFDTYPGVRVNGAGAWLSELPAESADYVPGTGIVHVVRKFSGVTLDEYHFTPMSLADHASVMLVKVTRNAGSGPVDAYGLFNYRLGAGGPDPTTVGEGGLYVDSRSAIYEYGPANVAFAYGSIGASTHHAMSPANPYDALRAGANLGDNADTGGSRDNVVCGLQTALGDIPPLSSAWAGWYTVLDKTGNAQAGADRVRSWIGSRGAARIYADEVASWEAWATPPPASASADEAALSRSAQAVLRMGQVREPGSSHGQMLASLAPGVWNIAWVRDMAYATVALARTGHLLEAKAAIAFQLQAQAGNFVKYVGRPYKISVVRYFGDGTEEADTNADGPNIELDGFGLFLWEVEEYIRASNDLSALSAWWPVVSTQVADVLGSLQEPGGLIAPDSSIWEVHWNGKQRHFAYTTITAAHGLCSAARLADRSFDPTLAAAYRQEGTRAIAALLKQMRTADGALIQSPEGLAAGSAFIDASVIEAFNFGLFHPNRVTARATLETLAGTLVPPSGHGFTRSDVPAAYDSQEWVFIDLRMSRAYEAFGDTAGAGEILGWNVAQARSNANLFAELHDRETSDYAGAVPMVGFGAGAFLLALAQRGTTTEPSCGAFADEPPDPVAENGGPPVIVGKGKPPKDAGAPTPGESSAPSSDEATIESGCSNANRPASTKMNAVWLGVCALAAWRRRRQHRRR